MRAEEVIIIGTLVTAAVLLIGFGWVINSQVRTDWVVAKIKRFAG